MSLFRGRDQAIKYLVGMITLPELKEAFVKETLHRYSRKGAAKALGVTERSITNFVSRYGLPKRRK